MRLAFSDRELDVMTVLWQHGPSTAGEVREQLAARDVDLAYNTVLSVLRTLEEKGHVGHVVEGKAHRYRPLVDRARAGQRAVTRMLDTVFGGSAELLLTHLVRDRRVDAAELKRLRKLLDDRLKSGRPRRSRGEDEP
ncbi:MAG TPA: BlaI/MecI/CopY family transcriptional regulator [Gemmatimonadaceae bacterium]